MSSRIPRSSIAVRTGTSGISSSWKSALGLGARELDAQHLAEPPGDVGVLAGVLGDLLDRHLGHLICFWPRPISSVVGIFCRSK